MIKCARLSVDFIIGLPADGWVEGDIVENYPGIAREDITACLADARDLLRTETIHTSTA